MDITATQHMGQLIQDGISHESVVSKLRKPTLRGLVSLIMLLLECSFGFHLGMLVGGMAGWTTGYICREHFTPLRCTNYDEATKWYGLPDEYGRYGVIVGAILGTVLILLITIHNNTKQNEQAPSGVIRKKMVTVPFWM